MLWPYLKNITSGIDGGKWIRIKKTKTKTLSSTPLLPVAEEISDRYQDYPEVKSGKFILSVFGHKDLRTTHHYAKIVDRKISDDMKVLREKLDVKEKARIKKGKKDR